MEEQHTVDIFKPVREKSRNVNYGTLKWKSKSKVLGLPRPRPTWPVWGQHFCSLSLGIINKVSVDKFTTGSNVRSRSDPLFLRPHDVTFGFTGGERKERNRSSPFQISNSRRRLDDCTHCSLGNQPASSSTGGQDDVMVVERTWS